MKSNPILMKKNIYVEYHRFVTNGFHKWSADGPYQWLAKWKDLMMESSKYEVIHFNWMTTIFAMWQKVFNLNSYFKTLEKKWFKNLIIGWPSDRIGSIIFETDPKTDGFRIGFKKIDSNPTNLKIIIGSPTKVRLHKYCIISLNFILIYALFN